jgi:hypothetical protein
MTHAQRTKAFYVTITLMGPKRKGKRSFLVGGGQCIAGRAQAEKKFKSVFKKLTGHEPIPW